MSRVTLADIAKKVGYSKNTVSLALRGDSQIPPPTRDRIRKTADAMGYQPNAVVSHLMAQLRASQSPRFQAKLALVNANRDQHAFRTHPTVPTYIEGCERRAARLGYSLDRFWLHDPTMRAETWIRVLQTRNIKGIILVGLMDQNRLPAHLRPVWETFPTVVTGVRTRDRLGRLKQVPGEVGEPVRDAGPPDRRRGGGVLHMAQASPRGGTVSTTPTSFAILPIFDAPPGEPRSSKNS